MRRHRGLGVVAAVVAVSTLAGAAFGLARGGIAASAAVPCNPRWFVPSVRFAIVQQAFVQPNIEYRALWRTGLCRIDPRTPFSYRLVVVGADGMTVSSQDGSFSGDMNPGGTTGDGSTIRLTRWCAHQPVRIRLTGAGPSYARTGQGYRLTLGPLSIRCD